MHKPLETDLIPDCGQIAIDFPASQLKLLSVPGTVRWAPRQDSGIAIQTYGLHFFAQVAKAKDGGQSCQKSQEERAIQGQGHSRFGPFSVLTLAFG